MIYLFDYRETWTIYTHYTCTQSMYRQLRGDLLKMHKLLNNSFYYIKPSIFLPLSNMYTTKGPHCKLFKFRSRLLVRHHFFNCIVEFSSGQYNFCPNDCMHCSRGILMNCELQQDMSSTLAIALCC